MQNEQPSSRQDKQDTATTWPSSKGPFSANLTPTQKRIAIKLAITRIAEVTNGTMSDLKQEVYADTLEDLEPATLAKIFEQAERTCKFLPVPAELREMAGIGGDAEGLASWAFIQKVLDTHLQRSGAEGYALCAGTGRIEWDAEMKPHCKRIPIPEIPAPIERAVRLCGGWARLKELNDTELPWAKKEFLLAVASYDKTQMACTRLLAGSALDMVKKLSGAVKGLSGAIEENRPRGPLEQQEDWKREEVEDTGENTNYGPEETTEPIATPRTPKLAGEDMTDKDWEERRNVLHQQAQEIQRKVNG